jgi:hypothetical protein
LCFDNKDYKKFICNYWDENEKFCFRNLAAREKWRMDVSVVTAVYIVERVILEKNEKFEMKPKVH